MLPLVRICLYSLEWISEPVNIFFKFFNGSKLSFIFKKKIFTLTWRTFKYENPWKVFRLRDNVGSLVGDDYNLPALDRPLGVGQAASEEKE